MPEDIKIERKKRSLSLIQPTSVPTLGNYLGAMKGWSSFQEDFDTVFGVADLHSITVRQDPQKLRKQTMELYAMLMAVGLDPDKSILFVQSHVPQHSQLGWLLNCYTQFGELNRMTQFKDKSQQHADNVNAGLFTYPCLMAADILLYQADIVPVGADQKQHLEIARDIAERFNGIYGNVFTVPEPYIPKAGARVMSLADPTRKMSKSDPNPKGTVYLSDEPNVIMKKFKSAVTDSEMSVRYAEGKDGINNLMTIYSVVTGRDFDAIEKEFDGRGYGDFKKAVGEAVVAELEPVQKKYKELLNDKAFLQEKWQQGAEMAQRVSQRTLDKAMKKIGFLAK
ncbi:MAG: tryptophan--tRNA ligase [Acetobacter sp.]|nr:tryptophan--tRNA ligase [Bacteroides sp.]MCM1340747.1 tryptophan--tRNA ligase [Acetobacter sp.]MCM1433084.1 tryptophan--tRNA ligase [Clostridiales bacterium]